MLQDETMLPIIERESSVTADGLVPAADSDNSTFWEGLQRRQLLLQRCVTCGQMRFPVSVVCPYCRASETEWQASSGGGEIFSFTEVFLSVLQEFPEIPYVVLCVQLDDGPRFFGRLLSPATPPAIGQRVEMVLERWACGRVIPAFQFPSSERGPQ